MLEQNKLYTFIEVLRYLQAYRKGEVRMFVNYPGRKKLRALMFDDGDKFYSLNETAHTLKIHGRCVTKCIFNEGNVVPMIKLIEDDFQD